MVPRQGQVELALYANALSAGNDPSLARARLRVRRSLVATRRLPGFDMLAGQGLDWGSPNSTIVIPWL